MVELMITLLIGALLLAWGIPNYRDLKVRKQVVDAANEMAYSLSLARAEGIRYGRTVTVAPTDGDWNEGWLVTAPGIDGNPDLQIYQQDALNSQLNLTQLGDLQGSIQFNNVGELVGGNEGLFNLSHITAGDARNIRVTLSGTTRVIKP